MFKTQIYNRNLCKNKINELNFKGKIYAGLGICLKNDRGTSAAYGR